MIVLELILEFLFYTVCGWVGHVVVKLVTLGRVDLDWGSGSESVVAECIGFFSVLLVAGIIAWMIHR